jgi:hypothetical protein
VSGRDGEKQGLGEQLHPVDQRIRGPGTCEHEVVAAGEQIGECFS